MSVTFWNPKAEQVLLDTFECHCVDYSEDGSFDEDCCHCTEGVVQFYGQQFELNLSNGNAAWFLTALKLGTQPYGELEAEAVPAVLQRVMVLLNGEIPEDAGTEAQEWPREARVTHEDGLSTISSGPRVIEGGKAPGYYSERLRDFQKLLHEITEIGGSLVWG